MGILSKAKSKLKSVVNTAKQKVVNSVKNVVSQTQSSGRGSGGGGGGSFSAPKVNNAASVIQAKQTAGSRVTIPSVSSGPQSVVPKQPNQSTIPSPLRTQIYTDPYTGKTKIGDTSKPNVDLQGIVSKATKNQPAGQSIAPKIDVQGTINKATGGKPGAQSRVSGTTSPDSTFDAGFTSLASDEYTYGLGDLGVDPAAEATSFASLSAPTSSSRQSSTSSSTTSSSGGGGGGATAPTSSRGADSVSASDQAMARAQAELERIQREVGNLTGKDESAAADAVSSDAPEVQEETSAMNKLKQVDLSPSTKALRLLDDELKQMKKDLVEREKTISKNFDVQKAGVEGGQASEMGQTAMGIADAGGFLGFSGSGQGVLLSLAESHRAELTALESERQQRLQEARDAAANRRYDIVRLKADEIARIDQETYERTQTYNTQVKQEADKQKEETRSLANQKLISDAIKGGATNITDVFSNLGGKVPIEDISKFFQSAGKTSSSKIHSFNPTQKGLLIGAGLTANEVVALNDAINEVGYTDEVRMSLPASVREVADKIYLGKTNPKAALGGGGGAVGSSEMESMFRIVNQSGAVATQEKNWEYFNYLQNTGQTEALENFVNALAMRAMPVAQRNDFAQWGAVVRMRGELSSLEDEFKKSNPNMYTTMMQNTLPFAAASKDPDWLNFVSRAQAIISQYRNNLYGASLTDNELKQANISLPNWGKDTFNDVIMKLDSLDSYARQTRNSLLMDSAGNFNDASVTGKPNESLMQGSVNTYSTPIPGEDVWDSTVGQDSSNGYWGNVGDEAWDFAKSLFGR